MIRFCLFSDSFIVIYQNKRYGAQIGSSEFLIHTIDLHIISEKLPGIQVTFERFSEYLLP